MAVKSIIDIDIRDANFKKFLGLYDAYKQKVKKDPSDWHEVAKGMEGVRRAGKNTIEGLKLQEKLEEKIHDLNEKDGHTLEKNERTWGRIVRLTKQASTNAFGAIKDIIRWTGVSTVVGGLLGGGSLYGLDRLAASVSSGRRSSLGLGLSYGQERAFHVNFGRLVSTDQLLGGVNEALSDITKRANLHFAGLSEADIQGKNTGDVSLTLIQRLKDLADKTPRALIGQTVATRGLEQFGIDVPTFERIKATPREEIAQYIQSSRTDTQRFKLGQDTQRRWQDFLVKLEESGQRLENVLVHGLDKLVGPLTKLSEQVADTAAAFIEGDGFDKLIEEAKGGLQQFTSFLGSDSFKKDVKSFIDDVGILANGIDWLVKHLPGHATVGAVGGAYIGGRIAGLPGAAVGGALGYVGGTLDANAPGTGMGGYGTIKDLNSRRSSPTAPLNNPGNLRKWGGLPTVKGFAQFPTPESGIAAIAKQLQLYQKRDQLNTIQEIITKYAPSSENDTASYIKFVSKQTGFGAADKLDLGDQGVLSKLVSAITKRENVKSNYSPQAVVTILNNTGGNSIVTTAQLPH